MTMRESTQHHSAAPSLDQLIDQFVGQLRSGQNPTVEEYKDQFPQLADEISELFPMLKELECHERGDSAESSRKTLETDIPEQLGEYAVIRELGRGGMGVVYEALHETMQRRVALKVLPKSFASRHQFVERFMKEARSAGQLHHTNIVPVFEVGNVDGHHFYAMQYIHGQNLDTVIHELRQIARADRNETAVPQQTEWLPESDDSALATISLLRGFVGKRDEAEVDSLPQAACAAETVPGSVTKSVSNPSSEWSQVGESTDSYFHRVALVGIQVADALEFAHEHGVLHRDIKPGNLILDTTGVVWVTDFGLAKNDGDNLTHTGDVVGTLRYMAPERFDGQVDRRSDVYSLGLTLYELCTLQPAFGENDRAKLIKNVMHQSPMSPRQIRPDIPKDLETIIVKATAREAADRYQSSADFRADLTRFSNGSPVKARRISMTERIWRWSKRYPSRAALVVSLMLLSLTLVSGSLFVAYRENKHSRELESENLRARMAEKDARASEQEARASEQKTKRASLASQAHLFWAQYNSGVSRRTTGTPGQYFDAVDSLSRAYATLPKLELSERSAKRRRLAVRCQAIAAMTNIDLRKQSTLKNEVNGSALFATDFENQRVALPIGTGVIEIRNLETKESVRKLQGPEERVWTLLFSPDGSRMVSVHLHPSERRVGKVVLWDVTNGKKLSILSKDLSRQPALDFSQDGKRLVVATSSGFKIVQTSDGREFQANDLEQSPTLVRFFDNDQRIALVTDRKKMIRSWSIRGQKEKSRYRSREQIFSLDGDDPAGRLVAGCERIVLTWPDGDLNQEPESFVAHGTRVTHVSISPNGRYLFTSGWDNTTRVFEAASHRMLLQLNSYRLNNALASSDGRHIGLLDRENQLSVWEFR